MKKCIICEKDFEVSKKGSGGQNRIICYHCLPDGLERNERNNIRKALYVNKARQEKLERGCDVCSYNKCASALEWHHTDEMTKEADPSYQLNKSWESYKKETEKCILLCANCHREEHEKKSMGVG